MKIPHQLRLPLARLSVGAGKICVLLSLAAGSLAAHAQSINVSLLGSPGGSQPSTPVQGPGGYLYGVTSAGGANGTGIVYRASLDGTSIVPLHTFASLGILGTNADGATPVGQLTVGADGNLYGVTQAGGANGSGEIFRVAPDGSGFTVLHSFNPDLLGTNTGGANPTAALTLGSDGSLYGTTSAGGASGQGTVFKVGPTGAGFTDLHDFTGGADGGDPMASLTAGDDGVLYGTTKTGGANGLGTVFSVLGNGSLASLHAFSGADGSHPVAALDVGPNGDLYGTTADGGANGLGEAFSIAPDGSAFTPIASFNAATGAHPMANLTVGPDGDLLGTSSAGGANGAGTVVQLGTDGDLTSLYSFPSGDVAPTGLSVDSAGLLHAAVNVSGAASLLNVALPPVITSPLTTSGTLNQPFSYQVAASGNPTAFSATGLPAGLSINAATGLISGMPNSAGVANATISATSALGTASKPLTLTILPQGPGLTVTALPNAQVGQPYGFQVTANGNPTSFSATGLPAGLSINPSTGLIVGTPTQAGSATVSISAAGASGLSTASFTLPVLPAAPVITSPAGANVQVGTPFNYQIAATSDPTSFSATGLPAGLSLDANTGLISGTPTELGLFPIDITAGNAGGDGAGTTTLSVTATPVTTPIVTSPAGVSLQVGTPTSYQIVATGDPTSFTATGLPPGLTIDPNTGLISGTPTQGGSFPVTVQASGPTGSGTATVTMAVSGTAALPAAPMVTSPNTASAQIGTPFTYQITATHSPTSYGATGLPPGLTVDPTSGLISGTPTELGAFSFVISATNAGGTGLSTVSVQVIDQLPVVTIVTSTPSVIANSGRLGRFKLTRTGDTSQPLFVIYAVHGNAINGVDYSMKSGAKKFKAGRRSVFIAVFAEGDLQGQSFKKLKLTLTPGNTYTVGSPGKAKILIER